MKRQPNGPVPPTRARGAERRDRLIASIAADVVGFQEESVAFDEVAARVLAVDRGDLPCMTLLLFGGPAPVERLAGALHVSPAGVRATVDRLQLAGYARRSPGRGRPLIELTEHAREWIARIWEPLGSAGVRLLSTYSRRDLATMHGFMTRARAIQERHVRTLRQWLEQPRSTARRPHHRGGLAPAALRRVQVFVEASLDRPIRLADLAGRAGLSVHHFARAFKASAGVTPRAYVEQRRIERARQLIADSDRSLADIAVATGFNTQSRLTTAFKRATSFTPARYRHRFRG